MFSVRYNFQEWYVFKQKLDKQILSEAIHELAEYCAEQISEYAPVRTGLLAGSVKIEKRELYAVVGPTAYYAPFVEFGTKPHMIYPRRARALRFEVGGEVVFAKRVSHPGTQAQEFVKQAVKDTIDNGLPIIRKKVIEAIEH